MARPNIIAHRGACKKAPQNTAPAFQIARDMGVDGYENDVHFTKDGRIVVCHNHTIDETSNGTGLISEKTFDELRSYDFGSYFSSEFAGTKIPTLEEFLEIVKGCKVINVEIKSPHDGNFSIADAVIEMAKNFGVFGELVISSFDVKVLERAKEYCPDAVTALLYDMKSQYIEEISKDAVKFAKGIGCSGLHPVFVMVSGELIAEAHENKMFVNPWTVDNPSSMQKMAEVGCDGLITNYPDVALQLFKGE